jgi:hypothetical protein
MFMKEQGYDIEENILEQDNKSAIRLAVNGRLSAGPRSRHIDIWYFWIKDRVKSSDIQIQHCPTLQMLGDLFTKALQGALFRKFRDVILGHKRTNTLQLALVPSVEERVENQRPDMDEIKQKSTSKTTGTGTRTEMSWQLVKQKKERSTQGTKVS